MMYDTIVTESPYLSQVQKDKVMDFCDRIEKKRVGNGELMYEYYISDVPMKTFDYRIRLKMCNYEWVNTGNKTKKIEIDKWYIKVECSVHKMICGNNVIGGPQRLKLAHKFLVNILNQEIGVILPEYKYWTLERIDVTSVYNLKTYDYAKEFLDKIKMLKYPKRSEKSVQRFDSAIAWLGTVNYHKHYLKYPEFIKHDYKILKKQIRKNIDLLYQHKDKNRYLKEIEYNKKLEELECFKNMVKGLYRIETEIKKVKLKDLFKDAMKDIQRIIEDKILCNNYKTEIRNIIRKGIYIGIIDDDVLFEYGKEVINNLFKDVQMDMNKFDSIYVMNILKSNYNRKANTLFATWKNLNELGYEYTKKTMNENTFYNHIRDLRKVNLGWNDVSIKGIKEAKGNNINIFEFYNYMVKNLEIKGENERVFETLNSVA